MSAVTFRQTSTDGDIVISELTPQQASLRRQDKKLSMLNSRLTVTEDTAAIVRGTLDDLEQIYLARVSQRLNDLFLEMVGRRPSEYGRACCGSGQAYEPSARGSCNNLRQRDRCVQ